MTKKWLGSFLIFLLIVIVGISIGLSIYYFLRNNEVFSFGTGDEQSITQYANVGETFDIAVTRTNASSDEYSLQSLDESVAKFKEKFKDDESANVEIGRLEALAGGRTTIQLITTNEAYKNLNVSIYVGNGTAEYPFYIRSYQDLSAISEDNASGMTLSAHYQQVADIDILGDYAFDGLIYRSQDIVARRVRYILMELHIKCAEGLSIPVLCCNIHAGHKFIQLLGLFFSQIGGCKAAYS